MDRAPQHRTHVVGKTFRKMTCIRLPFHEYIQIYRYGGLGDDPAGPYDFHLRPPASGVLYDAHRHYGWVGSRTYDSDDLAEMGYTQTAALAGLGDGLGSGGSHPYVDGRRLCHGDCFMGPEGMGGAKPSIREATPTATRVISGSVAGLVYDHVNDRWFDSAFTGSRNQVVAASLYLTVPFAEDVSISHIRLFGGGFDPTAQNPSPRADPALTRPCHLAQSGQLHAFASYMNVTDGESLNVPVLPQVRYAAFIRQRRLLLVRCGGAALAAAQCVVGGAPRPARKLDRTDRRPDRAARRAGAR